MVRWKATSLLRPISLPTIRPGQTRPPARMAQRATARNRSRQDAGTAGTGTLPAGQGLVGAGVAVGKKQGDDAGAPASWSLKWWGPSAARRSSPAARSSMPVRRRAVIAAMIVAAGIAIALLL